MLHNLKIGPETRIGWCSQNFVYGTWDLDGNGKDLDIRSSTNYLGFFLATKMVVPLEMPQFEILALNRKMQFPFLIMANIFMRAQYDHKEYLHKFSWTLETDRYFPWFNSSEKQKKELILDEKYCI